MLFKEDLYKCRLVEIKLGHAPNTAMNFLFLGLSLLLLSRRRPNYLQAQFLAIMTVLIALLGLLGYIYGNAYFYTAGSLKGMAVYTAIAFLLLSLGILFVRPERGLIAVVVSSNAGGLMAQRLLPTTIVGFGLGTGTTACRIT